jgi:hypothetical protein
MIFFDLIDQHASKHLQPSVLETRGAAGTYRFVS